jgi:putative FmdB family regulatory protein
MAHYDYKCNKCNTTVTITKPMKDASNKEYCIECNEELQRVFTANHNKWNCSGSFARGSF